MATSLLRTHPFGDAYAAQARTLSDGRWAGLQRAARAEIARGLPGPKHEEWRFTPLTDLARVGFIPAAAADDVDVSAVPSDHPPPLSGHPAVARDGALAARPLCATPDLA